MNAKLVYIQIGHLIPQNYARYTVYLYLMGLVNQLKPGGRNLVAMGKSEKLLLNA